MIGFGWVKGFDGDWEIPVVCLGRIRPYPAALQFFSSRKLSSLPAWFSQLDDYPDYYECCAAYEQLAAGIHRKTTG
jgi:hypothetical protein